jgi:CMP-N,N'-diacetyllegionaminic acid synthase
MNAGSTSSSAQRHVAATSGVLGLITARGGSKRLPGKNLAVLGGKPLIAWTIDAALASNAIDRLIVSTDDPAIAEASRAAGAEVPFLRPDHLAEDATPHLPVVQHALAWMAKHEAFAARYVVVLQPTTPLRTGADIAAAVDIAETRDAACVVGVTPMHGRPSWLLRQSDDGRLQRWQASPQIAERNQDAAPTYIPNGAMFVVRSDIVRSGADWYGDATWPYVMPHERSLDIDEPWDLHLARLIVEDRSRKAAR